MAKNRYSTGIIADTHLPFEHKHYLDFCLEIFKMCKCENIVHIGDFVDNHAISYHEHDPDGWSPEEEMKQVDKHAEKWFKAFPNLYLCRGNHDSLVDRKGKTIGLPRRCFKPFREIWQLPKGWKDGFEWVLDGVLYKHGTGMSGRYAHVMAAERARMSTVCVNKKKYLNKYVIVKWQDPRTEIRTSLESFMEKPLADCESVGKVMVLNDTLMVLSADCATDKTCTEYDLTAIPLSIITYIGLLRVKK